ncbi:MAG: threonine aldolase family protein [Flavobacteriaceae bacterium]
MINLISDTVTKPTPEMLDFMMSAKVGDDVFKNDESTNALEEKVARFFNKEAALFFPSGTMANQTAIKLHTEAGDQVICDHYSHIYNYEGGGASFNSGVSCKLIKGDRGRIAAEQVKQAINPPDFYHSPRTRLVSLENTTNKGGGACYELQEIKAIKEVCTSHGLAFHLDGARLWNALVAKNHDPKEYGAQFDTISVCFSKGLGAPIGSALLGSKAFIDKALRIRKILGGGMRQVGYLASAASFAMDHHFERLAIDHRKAKELSTALSAIKWVKSVEPTETNIVIFNIDTENSTAEDIIQKFKAQHIDLIAMDSSKLRFVTHLDYSDQDHDHVLQTLKNMAL